MNLKRIVAGTAIVGTVFILAGCSSDSDSKSSSSTTTSKDAVCADKTALENSVKSLKDVDLTGGKSSIDAAVKKVKKNLDALGESVKTDLKPEVDDVKSALTDLQDAAKDFGSGSLTDNLRSAGTAIANVGSTTGTLFSSLSSECPSS